MKKYLGWTPSGNVSTMDYPIRIATVCKCKRTIVVIATEYKVHNQDGSLHTCGGTMADSEHLTYRVCSQYISCRCGDESFSRCKFTGHYCDADEAGLECSIWEEEKAEILKEEHTYEVSEQVEEGRQFIYYHFQTARDELNAMLWSIADPDKPGVEDDIKEILTLYGDYIAFFKEQDAPPDIFSQSS